jgi:hypothetical protein
LGILTIPDKSIDPAESGYIWLRLKLEENISLVKRTKLK